MPPTPAPTDVVARFWRTAESHREDGPVSVVPAESVGRRRFLQVLGSAIAVPSLAACTRQPKEEIVPYVKQPEELVPGRPLFYASAVTLGGIARPVLVEQHMGRPTKVEGNPDHPASLGGTDHFAQAEILQLYDPDRSQTVKKDGEIAGWGELAGALQAAILARRAHQGAGLHIVTGETTSPTLFAQLLELRKQLPAARWYVHEPVGHQAELAGLEAAYGQRKQARYRLDRAEVIVSLDADFLGLEGNPRYVRDWAEKRGAATRGGTMNRLYAVHSAPQLTAANADHRALVRAADVEHAARLLAARVFGLLGAAAKGVSDGATLPPGVSEAWLGAAAEDLVAAAKGGAVVAGQFQPPVVHRLAAEINAALGSIGHAVAVSRAIRGSAAYEARTLADLADALGDDQVELLVVSGCNPLYDAPPALRLAERFAKAKLRVHHGLYFDETAAHCHWHVPACHALEMWSDALADDGTAGIIQPLIEPLYAGKSEHELFAVLSDRPDRTGRDIVRAHWQGVLEGEFEPAWRRLLHHGFWKDRSDDVGAPPPAGRERPALAAAAARSDDVEVIFRPDHGAYDGRYANNAWLQEMPKPITQLTWDNAALMAPATAQELSVENGDVIRIARGEQKVDAPVWVVPGVPAKSIVLPLGYGRERAGKVAKGAGFNAYPLRAASDEWHFTGATITKLARKYQLATAQPHDSQEGRDLAKSASLAAYRENQRMFAEGEGEHENGDGHEHEQPSLYPRKEYPGYSWGMTIDLTSCIGCSACLVACQAENNVPVVGKDEVLMGREMHWIRIDRYFDGDELAPETRFQPVPCMHCENAPCEAVCPVQATVHHDEGLNDMVYNRCVGTKDCSANCPYKVRRFNFFGYGVEAVSPLDPAAPSVRLVHNPDVTVRSYGVMEKCTYCVQRINYARVDAKMHDRPIRDGDVMTACQAACPARAITFGNINDAKSKVSRRKAEPRNYVLLGELNTLPRTSYLARLTNPNPKLAPAAAAPKKEEG